MQRLLCPKDEADKASLPGAVAGDRLRLSLVREAGAVVAASVRLVRCQGPVSQGITATDGGTLASGPTIQSAAADKIASGGYSATGAEAAAVSARESTSPSPTGTDASPTELQQLHPASVTFSSPGPQQLPASSINLLHGCVAPTVGLPPLQRGELRRCGTTFHPELAERVQEEEVAWAVKQRAAGRLGPQTVWQVVAAQGYLGGLPPEVVCFNVARLLGLTSAAPKTPTRGPLPEGPVVHPGLRLHPKGLCSAQRLPAGEALAVVGGYVLPALTHGSAFVARGHEALRPAARGQLRRLAALVGEDEAAEGLVWPALARLWRLPFPSVITAGYGGLELHQLGHGNSAAMVTDPRVSAQPPTSAGRTASAAQDEEEDASILTLNSMIIPVSVHGCPLLVLMALRALEPGELLKCARGAAWAADLDAPEWRLLRYYGLTPEELMRPQEGRRSGAGGLCEA
ncbi:hypothetical protein GPECTOR_10g784 [Gonium pectorale]|uniref:SET domain-containing protein n=1 Tax=Gonium pectorale TaxID=33097 RepID=A0A150GQQ0_GONPE|nr:hypothetical protein GPECTOR_10g784 [Gonium pectorale]|eukprot:KXZ52155.1 hypothetical protein GPECTOR_10g784 [Gonium pectorale]